MSMRSSHHQSFQLPCINVWYVVAGGILAFASVYGFYLL